MSIGFRKSMFGFNCSDVLRYVEESHKTFSEKETELNEKISSLTQIADNQRGELAELKAEKARIERELKEYTDKYDEIERLSQNIGKLYLVAQSNARAVMNSSAESRELAKREVESNINNIDTAHTSLEGIKSQMLETSNEFVSRLEELMASLEATRATLNKNDIESAEKLDSFEMLCSELSK